MRTRPHPSTRILPCRRGGARPGVDDGRAGAGSAATASLLGLRRVRGGPVWIRLESLGRSVPADTQGNSP